MKQDGRSWGNGLQARAFPVDGGARPRNRSAQAQVAAIRDQSRDANWVGRHLFEPGKPSRDVGMTPRDLRAGADFRKSFTVRRRRHEYFRSQRAKATMARIPLTGI